MKKKLILIVILALLIIGIINLSFTNATDPLKLNGKDKEVIKKVQGEAFTVEIEFKNIGRTEGQWNVNIVFEGEEWFQKGNSQNLELKPNERETLSWTGTVPPNAPINTIARLVVYYEDSFKALDWWIQVVPGSELAIKSSFVR